MNATPHQVKSARRGLRCSLAAKMLAGLLCLIVTASLRVAGQSDQPKITGWVIVYSYINKDGSGHVVPGDPNRPGRAIDGNVLGLLQDMSANKPFNFPDKKNGPAEKARLFERMNKFIGEQFPGNQKIEDLIKNKDSLQPAAKQEAENQIAAYLAKYKEIGGKAKDSFPGVGEFGSVRSYLVRGDIDKVKDWQPPPGDQALRCNLLVQKVSPELKGLVKEFPSPGEDGTEAKANNIGAAMDQAAAAGSSLNGPVVSLRSGLMAYYKNAISDAIQQQAAAHFEVNQSPSTVAGLPNNTGPYIEKANEARKFASSTDSTDRAANLRNIVHISPQQSGFGGVVLGNNPVKVPPVRQATYVLNLEQASIEVELEGRTGKFTYSGFTPTELWSAYNFLNPGPDLQQLGARRGDLGLVGISRNNQAEGSWDYAIHPAIANTFLALDGMRLDMVLSLGDPRMPRLPASQSKAMPDGWVTYRWFDEPAVIKAEDSSIIVAADSGPKNILMRISLWGEKNEIVFDTTPYVEALYKKFDGLRAVNRFAQIVAVLSWLDSAGKLPPLPAGLRPEKINQPSKCYFADVSYSGAKFIQESLSQDDPLDPIRQGCHQYIQVEQLEAGRTYVFELTPSSSGLAPYLRLEDFNGRPVAESDQAGGKWDSGFEFRPTATDLYRLVVTSYKSGMTGDWLLKIWRGDLPGPQVPEEMEEELAPQLEKWRQLETRITLARQKLEQLKGQEATYLNQLAQVKQKEEIARCTSEQEFIAAEIDEKVKQAQATSLE